MYICIYVCMCVCAIISMITSVAVIIMFIDNNTSKSTDQEPGRGSGWRARVAV